MAETHHSQYTEIMSIRKITLVVVGLTFLGMLALLMLVQRRTLLNYFEREEQAAMRSGLVRLDAALDSLFADLERVGKDWGKWDETFEFIQGRNEEYPAENLSVGSMVDVGVNLFVFATIDGQVLASQMVDLTGGEVMETPESVLALLADGRFDGVLTAPEQPLREWVVLPGGPMMLVAQAILPTEGGVEAGGILLAGRLLDASKVSDLQRILNAEIGFLPASENSSPEAMALVERMTPTQPRLVQKLDGERLSGYHLYYDLRGQPVLLVQMITLRAIYQNGLETARILQNAILLMTLTFGIMTVFLLEWVVISPLTNLVKQVDEIGRERDFARRVQVKGRDELSTLGHEINSMLENLEEALRAREVSEANLRLRVNDLEMLYDVSKVLLSQVDSPLPIQTMCRLVVERTDLTSAWVGYFNKGTGEVTSLAGWHRDRKALSAPYGLPENRGLVRRAVKAKEPAVLMQLPGNDFSSAAMIPLLEVENVAGLLVLCSDNNGAFAGEGMDRLKPFANLTEMAVQNLRLFEIIKAGRLRAQALSKRLVEVQEEERREVARELHDEIGQILTGLKIQVDLALRSDTPEEGMQRLAEAQTLTNELIGQVRQLSLDLRPAMLDDFGLLPTLEWFFERYTRRTQIEVNFRHQGLDDRRFASELETAVYRVAQEALTNVARYAQVSSVEVTAWATEEQLRLQVSDEGTGFLPEEKAGGFASRGLAGMHERISLVGGELQILSAPGEGTQVIVALPLDGTMERRKDDREDLIGG